MAVPMSKKVGEGYKSLDKDRVLKEAVEKLKPYFDRLKRLGHMILVGGITPNARELLILNGQAVQLIPIKTAPTRKYYLHISGRAKLGTFLESDMLFLDIDLPCGCSLQVRYDLIDCSVSKLFVMDTCEEHREYEDGYDVEVW